MGSPEDRTLLESLREETGASLIGASTLRDADPEMRGPRSRVLAGRIRSVISASGQIPFKDKKFFSELNTPPVIFCSEENRAALESIYNRRAEVVVLPRLPQGGLSITSALDYFKGRGVDSLLIEGGGKLNYAALHEELVDEICLTITPKLSGDRGAAAFVDGDCVLGTPFLDLEMISCQAISTGEIFARYLVKK